MNKVINEKIKSKLLGLLTKPYTLAIFTVLYNVFLRCSIAMYEGWNPLTIIAEFLLCDPTEIYSLERDKGTMQIPSPIKVIAESLLFNSLSSNDSSIINSPATDSSTTITNPSTVIINETSQFVRVIYKIKNRLSFLNWFMSSLIENGDESIPTPETRALDNTHAVSPAS